MTRRADRLLQIMQALRRSEGPMTAASLAEALEVAPRTIYRDIVALQGARVPIQGEAGVGFVLHRGYDLPPLMFSTNELQALSLGAQMVMERGDAGLARAAQDALAKIKAVAPPEVADDLWKAALLVPHSVRGEVSYGDYLIEVRAAINSSSKLEIGYIDGQGYVSSRTIWPLGLYLYSHVTLICSWCEKRDGFRAFRSDRVIDCRTLEAKFHGQNGGMLKAFLRQFDDAKDA